MPRLEKQKYAFTVGGIGFVTFALAVLYLVNPVGSSIYPPCPFWATTDLYCPGCGSLRAVHGLLHGDLLGALSLNPLMVVSIPFVSVGLIVHAFPSLRVSKIAGIFYSIRMAWVALAVICLYWILRNVPVFPFNILAP